MVLFVCLCGCVCVCVYMLLGTSYDIHEENSEMQWRGFCSDLNKIYTVPVLVLPLF